MSKKYSSGIMYSTDPNFNMEDEVEEQVTLAKDQQRLKVVTDSKHRAGKLVTLVIGFVGTSNDLEVLGKLLKTKCGTGGSVKDGQVIIQGNYKEKIMLLLKQEGYGVK